MPNYSGRLFLPRSLVVVLLKIWPRIWPLDSQVFSSSYLSWPSLSYLFIRFRAFVFFMTTPCFSVELAYLGCRLYSIQASLNACFACSGVYSSRFLFWRHLSSRKSGSNLVLDVELVEACSNMGSTFRRESSSPHPFLFLLLAVFVGELPNNRLMVTRCFQIVFTLSFKLNGYGEWPWCAFPLFRMWCPARFSKGFSAYLS